MAVGNLEPEAFGPLTIALRPRLHRYCARMVGSAIDGEDVVQDALAKAAEALSTAGIIEKPESWLFRIAHNAALDALRRRKRQAAVYVESEFADAPDAAATADSRVAAASSLALFLHLPAAQRSSVVLIDVLGHSAEETASILDVSVASAKAALHRGRARLRTLAEAPEGSARKLDAAELDRLRAYADRFNARDFDALRSLLAEDVRLDLANRTRIVGRKDVSVYFNRYAGASDWRFALGLIEGRPGLTVSDPADPTDAPRYIVLLDWRDGQIESIRDFRFAPYVMEGLALSEL